MLLISLTHPNSRILTDKFKPRSIRSVRNLPAPKPNSAAPSVILHRIIQQIHQNLLNMCRAANQTWMRQHLIIHIKINPLFHGLHFYNSTDAIQQRSHLKWLMLQSHLTGFQLAHIQHTFDHLQQISRRRQYLVPAFLLLHLIIRKSPGDSDIAIDSIDWCPHVMTHPTQKIGFRHIRPLCLICHLNQLFLIVLFDFLQSLLIIRP